MNKLSLEELGRVDIDTFKTQQKNPIVVVLDNIRSMHNVGSFFRTADAFALESLYLCGITAQPPHREIHKTAIGATDSVDWKYFQETVDALKQLKEEGYQILAVEQTTDSLSLESFQVETGQKYALVFGNEVFGVDDKVFEYCDAAIEIPQFGTKHSLNVSVSNGVVLWHFVQQLLAVS